MLYFERARLGRRPSGSSYTRWALSFSFLMIYWANSLSLSSFSGLSEILSFSGIKRSHPIRIKTPISCLIPSFSSSSIAQRWPKLGKWSRRGVFVVMYQSLMSSFTLWLHFAVFSYSKMTPGVSEQKTTEGSFLSAAICSFSHWSKCPLSWQSFGSSSVFQLSTGTSVL